MSEKLQTITKEKKECIILGDLNVNYNKIDHQKVIKKHFIDNGFEQLIKSCTRITSESETLIDVVLGNTPNNISHTGVITASLSDHSIITCTRKMNNIRYQPSTITFRDFSKYNTDTINNELLSSDWESVYNSISPELAYTNFTSILLNVLNRNAPFVSKRIKGKPSPWLTTETKQSMNARDSLLRKAQKSKNEADWTAYRRARNFVTNLINRTKRTFFKDNLKDRSSHQDSFRKYLFFFSRSNLFIIFQEGPFVPRTDMNFPGGSICSSNRHEFSRSVYMFFEQTRIFQEGSICSSNRPYYLIEQILIFPETLI